MLNQYTTAIDACRICGSKNLEPLFSLGNQYVINFIDSEEDEQLEGPLDMVQCSRAKGGCGLVQLKHSFSPDKMYTMYWYRSGINSTMMAELTEIAHTTRDMAGLATGDSVIDIGSNDSFMLRQFGVPGIKLIGFEPARNLVEKYGLEGVDKVFIDYFNFPAWQKEFGDAKAKVITAIAMFYDLEHPDQFVADVAKCLHPEGVFVVQQNYLPYMLSRNVADNIAHEHLEYYSLTTFKYLMERHGLEVFDVQLSHMNGGSFRVYVKHKESGKSITYDRAAAAERIAKVLKDEEAQKLDDKATYDAFIKRVSDIGAEVKGFIERETAAGKKVYAYGASTRGNSLLQCFGIDHRLITAAAERNPDKYGKKTVGTLISIISEAQARAEKPDYFLVLPWQFIEEFKRREIEFLRGGGKFIVPLPEFQIIDFATAGVA